ncbi:hypothetical protein [Pseudarthrobacter sulfonivorans]|uniref:hypothetical protein n=1 Tax=Pseudarthrobacter sulfonivorans TaxID=121292 RepID=UPI0021056899|nr:hypothetical protein [Pseudarthrobacter sulfonivorans]
MKNFKVRVRRSIAAFAAVGVLSLTAGLTPASASATSAQDCKTNYQGYGYSNHADCLTSTPVTDAKKKHRR